MVQNKKIYIKGNSGHCMDARNLSKYILSDPRYDRRVINYAFKQYGLSFVRYIFLGLKEGRCIDGSKHLNCVLEDLFNFYEADEEISRRLDKVLAKIEPRIPHLSEEELMRQEEECVRRAMRHDLYHYNRILNEFDKMNKQLEELKSKLNPPTVS